MIQSVKDSFYIALRDRLAVRNPDRKVTIGAEARPAIVVAENELVAAASPLLECFHLRWVQAQAVTQDEPAPLLRLTCEITYATEGTDPLNAQDRGRILAAMDAELLDICRPGRADVEDYGETPPFAPGTAIFWSLPELATEQTTGRRVSRKATVQLFTMLERNAA